MAKRLKLNGIYPGYDGGDVNPAVLIESMIDMQGQEEFYAEQVCDSHEDLDALKYKVKKIEREIEELVNKGMAHPELLPQTNSKNKEMMIAYIKHVLYEKEFRRLMIDLSDAEDKLVKINSEVGKYKLLITTIQNSINTGIQVLSYLKHEEKMAGGFAR